ncbi:tryptophan halogenase [Colwellia sp. MT41]|uniref:tryptophan halogenase family protein n=1 Tax=Colwellia sp. MT41 TaxID=58049 RepID=UPI000717B593|nr:tryptophan halogenase family protein [Colwellia sp. MT41]ALO33937.1 tryptophan halogenase [Colwellia sp. MT41]
MSSTDKINNIVIVGGGSAGWMTAAMLSKQLECNAKGSKVNITLVESDNIGTVGVGEATIPPIKTFNRMLGIDENDFLKHCNGSIKLGISFENWPKKNHQYFHPFGRFAVDFDYIPFSYFWNKHRASGDNKPLHDYASAWHLAKNNKFSPPSPDKKSLFSGFDYAYHFDASLYANYLRSYSEKRGVKRQEGKITKVDTHESNGFISSVTLASGQNIAGDFFIDCSGTTALLINKTLGIKFIDWSENLLCNRAIAVQTCHTKVISPYTRSITKQSGWQWRIPLQTRMGNGSVHCSEFIDEQSAMDELISDIDGEILSEPRVIHFNVGRREKFWHKNCVAIGLSAGFLEPLESTSLHLIQRAVMRLIAHFPNKKCDEVNTKQFNNLTVTEYEHIRNFIILHYKATKRDDSEFWRYCQHMDIPDSLQHQIDLFSSHGHLNVDANDLFKQDNWLAVLTGQNIHPTTVAPIMAYKQKIDLPRTMNSFYDIMTKTVQKLPNHEDYLKEKCPFLIK